MKKKNTNIKMNSALDIEMLLKEYNQQINNDGKHSYDEHLHNDTGSGCCLCDTCECLGDTLLCCSSC